MIKVVHCIDTIRYSTPKPAVFYSRSRKSSFTAQIYEELIGDAENFFLIRPSSEGKAFLYPKNLLIYMLERIVLK